LKIAYEPQKKEKSTNIKKPKTSNKKKEEEKIHKIKEAQSIQKHRQSLIKLMEKVLRIKI